MKRVGIAITLLLLAGALAHGAPPEVTRVSQDLRATSYAMVFGGNFVDGQTTVKLLTAGRTWDAAAAKKALDAGVSFTAPPVAPAEARDPGVPLRVRENLMLLRLGLPVHPTPAVLWVTTDGGTAPGWVLNRPWVQWLGTDRTTPGARVRAFGRNLLGAPGKPPLLFLKQEGQPGVECKFAGGGIDGDVTDPLSLTYETSFTVPADLPLGRYQVWLHAGLGEAYGWSRPQELEIVAPEAPPALQVPAAKYGALADGISDDTAAIAQAIKEAQEAGGGTVVLPAGIIPISNVVVLPPKVSLVGAGMDATILRVNPRKPFQALLDMGLVPANDAAQGWVPYWKKNFQMMLWVQSQSRVADLSVDTDGIPVSQTGCGVLVANGKQECLDLVFERVSVIQHPRERNMSVEGKWIPGIADGWALTDVRRALLTHCRNLNIGVMYGAKAWYCRSERNEEGRIDGAEVECSLFEENHIRDLYGRRGFTDAGQYIGFFRNRVEETWFCHGGGEQFLHESGGFKLYKLVSAAGTQLTVADPPRDGKDGFYRPDSCTAVVLAGQGFGQIRRVKSFADGVFTLDQEWDVAPNAASVIGIGRQNCRDLFVRNYSGGGDNSLQLGGGELEQIVAGHEFKNAAVCMNYKGYGGSANLFNEYRNCVMNPGSGFESLVLLYYPDPKKPPEPLPFAPITGCEWRDNELQDVGFYSYGGSPWGDVRWADFPSQGALMIHTTNYGMTHDGIFQYGLMITGNHIVRARGGAGIFVGPDTSNVYVAGNRIEQCATAVSHYGRDRYVTDNK